MGGSSRCRPLGPTVVTALILSFCGLSSIIPFCQGRAQRPRDLILTKADFVNHPTLMNGQRQSKSAVAGANGEEASASLKVPAPFVVTTELKVKNNVLDDMDPNNRKGRTYTDEEGATVVEGTYVAQFGS